MAEVTEVKMKVCLVGDGGVGKTSLIRKYVFNEFDDRYLFTLGTNVSKKEITLPGGEGQPVTVHMMIWDIMGQKDLAKLFTEQYFKGANAGIAVCDCTDDKTLDGLLGWIDGMREAAGQVPIIILANKVDLVDHKQIDDDRLKEIAEGYGASHYFSSAKTGENVEKAFMELARELVM